VDGALVAAQIGGEFLPEAGFDGLSPERQQDILLKFGQRGAALPARRPPRPRDASLVPEGVG
jgi:hypothetical protein